MAVFKMVISDPESRKTFQSDVDQSKAAGLIGKRIGNQFNGDILGLDGYTLEITGGTDQDGFPMHPGLKGSGRTKMLLTEPPGFHPEEKGQRKRKTVRGNTISDAIVQINVKVIKSGKQSFEDLMSKEGEEESKDGKKEKTAEKKEVKKEEKKEPEEKAEEKSEEKSEEKPKEDKKPEKPEEKSEKEEEKEAEEEDQEKSEDKKPESDVKEEKSREDSSSEEKTESVKDEEKEKEGEEVKEEK